MALGGAMDELTKGLSRLGPQLESFQAQIDQLKAEVQELRDTRAGSEEVSELRRLLQELQGRVPHKADLVSVKHLRQVDERMQALDAAVRQKGEGSAIEGLENQVRDMAASLGRKVEVTQIEQVEDQLRNLSSSVLPLKAEVARLGSQLQSCEDSLLPQKADTAEVTSLVAKLDDLGRTVSDNKEADHALLEKVNAQYRNVTNQLQQKAEYPEVEQLKIQMHALSGTSRESWRAQTTEIEQLAKQVQEVSAAMTKNGEMQDEQLEGLRTDLGAKADNCKVERIVEQFKVLSDALAPKMRAASPRNRTNAKRPASARGTISRHQTLHPHDLSSGSAQHSA